MSTKDKVLVAVKYCKGTTPFLYAHHSYRYVVAIPLEMIPETMKENIRKLEIKNHGNFTEYFIFSSAGVPARATIDFLPGYVCCDGWNWKPAWLCKNKFGYVFESFIKPAPVDLMNTNWFDLLKNKDVRKLKAMG